MGKENMSEVFSILDHEEKIIANEGHALAAYFKVARKTNDFTGEPRKEWTNYVFKVRERVGKQPELSWYEITPKSFIGAGGKKVVAPKYDYLAKGKVVRADLKLKADDESFSYNMTSFKGIMLWEKKLIQEVEERAAKLRERLWRIRVLRSFAKAYLDTAKHMSKDFKKYYPFIEQEAQARAASLTTNSKLWKK